MKVSPYLVAIIKRGLTKRELRETANVNLEDMIDVHQCSDHGDVVGDGRHH